MLLKKLSERRKKSEQKAFETEALVHIHALFGAAIRLTRSASDAEDLVQDTYFKAFRAQEQYEPGTNCKAWLFRIMTNTFINKYRRKVKEKEILEGPQKPAATYHMIRPEGRKATLDPENHIVDRFFSDQVLKALENVPVDFRVVVVLSDIEGFSYKEIAEMADIPVGTVMSRLFRGRRILQEELFDYAVAEGVIKAPTAKEGGEDGETFSLDAYRKKKARKKA
jgi:RNA polymerase sigma-70 factor (ECF subfamily)